MATYGWELRWTTCDGAVTRVIISGYPTAEAALAEEMERRTGARLDTAPMVAVVALVRQQASTQHEAVRRCILQRFSQWYAKGRLFVQTEPAAARDLRLLCLCVTLWCGVIGWSALFSGGWVEALLYIVFSVALGFLAAIGFAVYWLAKRAISFTRKVS